MISFWREVMEESEQKGKIEGKLECSASTIIEIDFEFGLSKNDILERLQKYFFTGGSRISYHVWETDGIRI